MNEFAVFLFMVSVVVVPLAFVCWRNARRVRRWTEAAAELGFQYDQRLSMSGTIDGVSVFVAIRFKGTTAQKATVTQWTAQLPGRVPTGLDIRPEGMLMKAAQAVGLDDEKLGIEELDELLIVRTTDPAALRAWAQDDVVAGGLAELAGQKRFQLTTKTLWVAQPGQVVDVPTLTQRAGGVARMAKALSMR